MLKPILSSLLVLGACNAQAEDQQPDQQPAEPAQVQGEPEQPEPSVLEQTKEPDVHFVPTPQPVVDRMLELAEVDEDDVVYDLGSGDGRIVITAAQKYGARGVGFDVDPERIREARAAAREAGVQDLVEFRQEDLFEVDLSEATVVTLYLLPSLNLELRPKLLRELKPGTPVVSHAFDMGDWEPEVTEEVEGKTIYLWHIPEGGGSGAGEPVGPES